MSVEVGANEKGPVVSGSILHRALKLVAHAIAQGLADQATERNDKSLSRDFK